MNKACFVVDFAKKHNIPINMEELRQYDVMECLPFTNLYNVIADVDEDDIGICYTSHIFQSSNYQVK